MAYENSVFSNTLRHYENDELLKRVRNGDKKAEDLLLEVNLPLVASLSKKFLGRGYDYDDIYQVGALGLIKAIKNFNSEYNVKFSTYAVPMILGEIKRFLRDDGIVKISRNVKGISRKIMFKRDELTKELNREPTVYELAEYTKLSVEDIILAIDSCSSTQYLYDTVHQDDGSPILLIDKIEEKASDDSIILNRLVLKEMISKLDEKSRQIIMLRYFKDKTQIQVASVLGISQVQVSRIEKKILAKLKGILKEYWLKNRVGYRFLKPIPSCFDCIDFYSTIGFELIIYLQ